MADYSHNLLKAYRHWEVYLAGNQSYLGRCTVWCRREDATDLADATPEEQAELFVVLAELRTVATRLFSPDWFNYAFLGNETPHLHGHFLPRYAAPREILGTRFTDAHWGHNYRTDHGFQVPAELLDHLRAAYRAGFAAGEA